jgi:hypothetical protein
MLELPKILCCPEIATKGGYHNREIRTVRKTQHQQPEFGPKPGEIRKNQQNKVHQHSLGGRAGNSIFLGGKLSFILYWPLFPFSWAPPLLLHIFSLLLPTLLLSNLVHYMLSFSISYPYWIKFLYFAYPIERGVWRRKETKDRVTFQVWLWGTENSNKFIVWEVRLYENSVGFMKGVKPTQETQRPLRKSYTMQPSTLTKISQICQNLRDLATCINLELVSPPSFD